MSESEYRSAREAARARVALLETQLREHDAATTKIPQAPETSSVEQRKKLRDELTLARKSRRIPLLIGLALCVASFKHGVYAAFPNAFYQPVHGTNGAMVGIFFIGAAIAIAASRPSLKERKKERRLRAIIKVEDDEYRIAKSAIQKRIDVETEERAQIEAELDDARALAESDEKKA